VFLSEYHACQDFPFFSDFLYMDESLCNSVQKIPLPNGILLRFFPIVDLNFGNSLSGVPVSPPKELPANFHPVNSDLLLYDNKSLFLFSLTSYGFFPPFDLGPKLDVFSFSSSPSEFFASPPPLSPFPCQKQIHNYPLTFPLTGSTLESDVFFLEK